MRKKPIIFALKCELYPHTVVFYIGARPADPVVGRLCKRHKLWNGTGRAPNAGDGAAGTITFGSGCLVWLDDHTAKKAHNWLGNLAHEMCHILSNASHTMGCFMDKDTDEFHAYYAGWITRQVITRIQTRAGK